LILIAYAVVSNGVSARHVAASSSPPSRIGTGCADAICAIRADEAMTMSFGGSPPGADRRFFTGCIGKPAPH